MTAALALISAIITYKVIPWIKARTTQTQREIISSAVKTLVYAAEQLAKTGVITDKLQYVQDKLTARGITADRDEIRQRPRIRTLRPMLRACPTR